LNLHAYAGNNPTTYTDPFGSRPEYAGEDGQTESPDAYPPTHAMSSMHGLPPTATYGWRELG